MATDAKEAEFAVVMKKDRPTKGGLMTFALADERDPRTIFYMEQTSLAALGDPDEIEIIVRPRSTSK